MFSVRTYNKGLGVYSHPEHLSTYVQAVALADKDYELITGELLKPIYNNGYLITVRDSEGNIVYQIEG